VESIADSKPVFAEVAVEAPVDGTFTYSVPHELAGEVALGRRLLVPFGRRSITGYCLGLTGEPGPFDVRPVTDVLDPVPLFDERMLGFYRWLSSYYFAPLGEVLSMIRPAGASVRSRRRIAITEAGRAALDGSDGLEREILRAAVKGATLDGLARRMKGRPLYGTVGRLRERGLIVEETLLKTGASEKTARFVRAVGDTGAEEAEGAYFRRSPVGRQVYRHLLERGETSLSDLASLYGGAARIVTRLADKGLVEITERRVLRDPMSGLSPRALPHEPNPEQRAAIDAILEAFGKGTYSPFLLYGVTGSGKTLVYLKVLEEVVRSGKKAIFLAPEIALTPWPAAYLTERFPGRVALAHSGLSEGERYDEWRRIIEGEADIVVGARSALFSPLKDLGLIIVDEEHETSYKQEEGARYNARDAAIALARHLGITVVLGSATPSVETFYNSRQGKLVPLVLENRVMERRLPAVELADMRGRKNEVLGRELAGLLGEVLAEGNQALLFLNRRGFSSFLICRDCGHTARCVNCSVTLTAHKSSRLLQCHYCDLSAPIPDECPSCSGANLGTPGLGTEKVEEEVRALFPDVKVARMDRDTTRKKGSVRKILDAVEAREVGVLIGTQMVSKGHDFPGVTLVGVISGDTSLNIPDFRSAERTFQLITQAAGRAGRGEAPGRVIVQTLNPGHYCFTSAARHDYEAFFAEEIELRRELAYPPFSRLCCLRVAGPTDEAAARAAGALHDMAEILLKRQGRSGAGITLLGPAPALLAKLKGRYRWNLLVKGGDVKTLHPLVAALKRGFEARKPAKISLSVDMDPLTVT